MKTKKQDQILYKVEAEKHVKSSISYLKKILSFMQIRINLLFVVYNITIIKLPY